MVTRARSAGVGKSRLVDEFARSRRRGDASLRGRCLSYGEGITFWPLVEALRELAGHRRRRPHDAARAKLDALADGDRAAAERTAAAVGLTDAAYPRRRALLGLAPRARRLAASGPRWSRFEDLHWAEPTMLDLVEHLAATPRSGARPLHDA